MAMKALRGMVNGAMSELSSAVSGNRAGAAPASGAAAREHVLAVRRDYISQPRLSECPLQDEGEESRPHGPDPSSLIDDHTRSSSSCSV